MDKSYIYVTEEKWEEIKYISYFSDYSDVRLEYNEFSLVLSRDNIVIDSTLADNEIKTTMDYIPNSCLDTCTVDAKLNIKDYYVDKTYAIDLILDSNNNEYILRMNQNTYDLIAYDEIYQVSLMTKTDINVDSLVKQIARLRDGLSFKYKLIYPFDSQPTEMYEGLLLMIMNIGMISVLLITMIGSTFISYIIFKMIINTKLHDYAIFRTIGANQKVIKAFIYLENFYILIVSFVIFVVISLSLPGNIEEPFNAFKVFDLPKFFVYFILLLIMSLFISRRYCNKIFSNSVSKTLKTDLE